MSVTTTSFRTCIFELLIHRAPRSQQVRITPNKFRPFKALRICRSRLDLISTGQITMVSQAATLCYSHEGEEEKEIEFDSLIIMPVKNLFDHKTVCSVLGDREMPPHAITASQKRIETPSSATPSKPKTKEYDDSLFEHAGWI